MKLKLTFLFLSLCIFLKANSNAFNHKDFDVYHYGLSVNFMLEEKQIFGAVEVSLEVLQSTNHFVFALSEEFTIDSVGDINTGDSISVVRSGDILNIISSRTIAKGKKISFVINYHGYPRIAERAPWDGGFVWDKDQNGNPFVGVACEGEGAMLWWPNKNDLSDEPDSMDLKFRVPSQLKAIGNGRLKESYSLEDDKVWHWKINYPINPYNVTFYIGDYVRFSEAYIGLDGAEKELSFYVLKDNLEIAKSHFKQAVTMMPIFEKYFGAFPFEEDGYKLVEAPYLGMEHQTAIAYGNKFQNGYLSHHLPGIDFDYIIIHETGHEWWGNHVSMSHRDHLWLHESFTTYSELLYVQEVYGDSLSQVFRDHWMTSIRNKEPLVGVPEGKEMPTGDVYAKGALVLHGLRKLVGDSTFYAFLLGVQSDFSHKTLGTQEFLNYTEQELGGNAMHYLHQYLYHPELPQLTVEKTGWWFYKKYNIKLNEVEFEIEIDLGDEIFLIGETAIELSKKQWLLISESLQRNFFLKSN